MRRLWSNSQKLVFLPISPRAAVSLAVLTGLLTAGVLVIPGVNSSFSLFLLLLFTVVVAFLNASLGGRAEASLVLPFGFALGTHSRFLLRSNPPYFSLAGYLALVVILTLGVGWAAFLAGRVINLGIQHIWPRFVPTDNIGTPTIYVSSLVVLVCIVLAGYQIADPLASGPNQHTPDIDDPPKQLLRTSILAFNSTNYTYVRTRHPKDGQPQTVHRVRMEPANWQRILVADYEIIYTSDRGSWHRMKDEQKWRYSPNNPTITHCGDLNALSTSRLDKTSVQVETRNQTHIVLQLNRSIIYDQHGEQVTKVILDNRTGYIQRVRSKFIGITYSSIGTTDVNRPSGIGISHRGLITDILFIPRCD